MMLITNSGQPVSTVWTTASAVDLSGGDLTFDQPVMIYVGTGGDITVTLWEDDSSTLFSVTDNSFIPIYIKTLHQTGTTAQNMVTGR